MASLEKLLTFPLSDVYHLVLSLATNVLFLFGGGGVRWSGTQNSGKRVSFGTEDLDSDPNFVIYCGQTTLTVCCSVLHL